MNLADILRTFMALQKAEVKHQAGAAMRTLVLVLIAAVLALCALIFMMVGAYETLRATLPAWQAGGAVALGALAASLVVLGIAALPSSRRPPQRNSAPDSDPAQQLGNLAGEFVRDLKPRTLDVTIAAFVAGLLASRSSKRPRPDD